MRSLKTSEAAALLNVSPNTLRAWERRFGYPKPQRSVGRHRLYTHGEVMALRDALAEGLSISSAVSRAREGMSADAGPLAAAFSRFDREQADRALEAALALRTLERTVEEVLLRALEDVRRRHGLDSAAWAYAAQWASDWLKRAQRLGPPAVRPVSLLIGEACCDDVDPDAPAVRAFELFCERAGVRQRCLSVKGVAGLADVVSMLAPDAVVVAGRHARDEEVARWAYAVRSVAGPLPVALFRRDISTPLRARGSAEVLPSLPSAAQGRLLDIVAAGRRRALPPRSMDEAC